MVDEHTSRRTPLYTKCFGCPDQPSSVRAWIHIKGKFKRPYNGIMSPKDGRCINHAQRERGRYMYRASRCRILAEPTGKKTSNKFCGEKGAGSEGVSVGMLMKVLKSKIRI
jgi:hypothetical protein